MRIAANFLLYFLSIGVAAYAAIGYGLFPLGTFAHPDIAVSFLAHPIGIYTHAFAAIFALLLGPFQFSTRLRAKAPKIHRWIGRAYLGIGVLIGGSSGLYMAQFAYGGPIARLGFAALALSWLVTGAFAYAAIRRGEIQTHRKWMIRNFALAFAAVTLRLYIPLGFMAGVEFETSYQAIAWLCWVPNLLVAEYFFNTRRGPRRAAVA